MRALPGLPHLKIVPLAGCSWRRTTFAGHCRAGQLTIARRLTVGSSLNGAMVFSLLSGPAGSSFVVLFEQDRVDEENDCVLLGEDANRLGPPLNLAVEISIAIVECILVRCCIENVI